MLLVALIVGLCMPVMAEPVTKEKEFLKADYDNKSISGDVDSVVSYLADKGTHSSNPSVGRGGRFNNYYYYLKLNASSYRGTTSNILTINSKEGYLIKSVVLTARTENYNGGTVTASEGSVTTSGTSVTISVNDVNSVAISASKEMQLSKIAVTYEAKPVGGGDNEGGDVVLVDEDSYILDGDGNTPFYIRNKATGLYVKYGGSYGMDAIEGRAAHPFKAYKNNDNTYSLGTIHGYFNSMYSQASLFMDRKNKSESNWKIVAVAGESGVYYLLGENGRALASVGNVYGILEFRVQDADDIFQRWELVTENELLSEMGKATKANPVDITPVIKGAAFDYADVREVEEDAPFYPEIKDMGLPTPPTGEGYRGPTYSYVNYWEGFMAFAHYSAMWSDDPYVGSNTNLNGIGLSRNNIRNERVIEQVIEIPLSAGTYTFSYQGFYHARNANGELSVGNSYKPTMSIVALRESDFSELAVYTNYLKNYSDSQIRNLIDAPTSDKGYYVAGMLRDNRENDSYRDAIQFTLTENAMVGIRIHKPETAESSWFSKCQWMVAFDDFTLVYQGNDNSTLDQAILYYDRVKAAYLHATNKLYELAGKSYDNCTTIENNACVHWDKWNEAIEGVVTVNGVSLRGNTVTTPANKFAYLNGTATSNKIDTEKEFLEALAKIEEAYQAALKEHMNHATDITTEVISNPSFEKGNIGWELGYDGSVVDKSDESVGTVEGLDGSKFYTSGNNGQNTWTGRVSQETLLELEPGLYKLSASVATGGSNVTVYLVANGYYSGMSSTGFDAFVEHSVLFLVEEKGKVRIAAVGHNNPYAESYPLYGPHYYPFSGSSFRVDNFRLNRVADLPNGRLQLALAEVDGVLPELDEYAQEAALQDANSLNKFRQTTYTADADAKSAVNELYSRFQNTVKAQRTKNADMTYAIADPSFEHGIDGAWTYSEFTGDAWGDNGIYYNEGWIFTGSTGRKIFNTWQDGNASGPISQTITGIPNGTYRVTAVMASDQNIAVLSANGVESPSEALYTHDNNIGKLISVETQVTNNKLEISASAKDGKWYKVDNFRLTYLHNKLALDHADTDVSDVKADWYTDVDLLRPVATGKWHSFVIPFDMAVPENWDVRQLVDGTVTGDHLSMTFERVDEMVAGTPYMVRYYPQGVPSDPALDVNTDEDTTNDDISGEQKNIVTEYVDVDLATSPTSGDITVASDTDISALEFVGSYVPTTIPEGAIFISNNLFYVSKGTSKIKGYRGYIMPKGAAAKARTFGMRTRGGDDTGIESANNEEATVVGIYDINGVKLNEIQDGMNILRMSDGSTIKIMMK